MGTTELAGAVDYLSTLHQAVVGPDAAPRATELVCEGAVLFADISGFTPLAARLAEEGLAGVESLSEVINSCFGTVVDRITGYGGEVVRFPGDAIVAVWRPTDGLAAALSAATACARSLVAHPVRTGPSAPALRLKAALEAGPLHLGVVGGVLGRWELVAFGPAVAAAARLLRTAEPGELVLGEGVGDEAPPGAVLGGAQDRPRPDAAQLRGFLPEALLHGLAAAGPRWLGEFRLVSALFVQLVSVEQVHLLTFERLHEIVATLQAGLYRYEGALDKIVVDDKGLVALAVFGLPPVTHEDDPERAVRTAVELEQSLRAIGAPPRIGIATGRVYSGGLGAARRRDHTVLGSVVNLAARLMAVAEPVAVDEATARRAKRHGMDRIGARPLKGLTRDVAVYAPAEAWAAGGLSDSVITGDHVLAVDPTVSGPLLGRGIEESILADFVAKIAAGRGRALVLRGEAGIGKSRLLRCLGRLAAEGGVSCLWGHCGALHRHATWHPFGQLGRRMIAPGTVEERTAEATDQLERASAPTYLGGLLNDLLGVGFPLPEPVQGLSGAVRRDNVLDLLLKLLLGAQQGPRLLLIEDAHWMDPASWGLVERLLESLEGRSLGLVLTLRPEIECKDDVVRRVLDAAEVVDLLALSDQNVHELAQGLLRARSLAPPLARLVAERARGNPFFSEEVIGALVQESMVRLDDGVARLAGRHRLRQAELLPDSIAGVVTSRIDRLPAAEQLTLKVASVLGGSFDLELLETAHPEPPTEGLASQVARLRRLGLLAVADDGGICFRHALTREVTYGMLLFEQRRRLHRRVAEACEAVQGDAPKDPGLLLRHWQLTDDRPRALPWVEPAGEAAMRAGDYSQAAAAFDWGLEQAPEHALRADRGRWWAMRLGEAQVALGRHENGRAHLELALRGFGAGVPTSTLGLLAVSALQLLVQVGHRLGLVRRREDRAAQARAAARCYEQLGYIYYSASETLFGVHAALRMLNLAESAPASPVLGRAYAATALTASVVPLPGAARHYDRLARDVADELDDPSTRAYVHWIACLCAAGEGRWPSLAQDSATALDSAARLGDDRLRAMTLETVASAAYMQGELARCEALCQQQLETARTRGNPLWRAWALNGSAEALQARGRYDDAVGACREALAILTEESDHTEEIRALGLLARAQMRLGREEEALEAARRCLSATAAAELTAFNTLEGFAGTAEALLEIARQAQDRGHPVSASLLRDARHAVRQLRRFARVFPIGEPALLRAEARWAGLRGGTGIERRLQEAASAATRRGMTLEALRASTLALELGFEVDPTTLLSAAESLGADGLCARIGGAIRRDPSTDPS